MNIPEDHKKDLLELGLFRTLSYGELRPLLRPEVIKRCGNSNGYRKTFDSSPPHTDSS